MSASERSGYARVQVAAVRQLLQRQVRVELSDGRVVAGIVECVDALKNLVLRDAVDVAGTHQLGLVLVPGGAHTRVRVRKERGAEVDAVDVTLMKELGLLSVGNTKVKVLGDAVGNAEQHVS